MPDPCLNPNGCTSPDACEHAATLGAKEREILCVQTQLAADCGRPLQDCLLISLRVQAESLERLRAVRDA